MDEPVVPVFNVIRMAPSRYGLANIDEIDEWSLIEERSLLGDCRKFTLGDVVTASGHCFMDYDTKGMRRAVRVEDKLVCCLVTGIVKKLEGQHTPACRGSAYDDYEPATFCQTRAHWFLVVKKSLESGEWLVQPRDVL